MAEQNEDLARDVPLLEKLAEGKHPPVGILRADSEGILPDELSAGIRSHLAGCALCTILQRDLASLEPAAPNAAQQKKIRGSVVTVEHSRPMAWRFVFVGGLAAVLIVAMIVLRRPSASVPNPVATTRVPATFQIAVEKAPITIPAAMLPMRGASQGSVPGFDEWTLALKPYKEDDFAKAETAIGNVVAQYPKFAEGYFYLGVSQLLQNKNDAARGSLEKAVELLKEDRRAQAEWYFGIALARSGRLEDASRQWSTVCGAKGPYSSQACAAISQLRSAVLR